ncbi:MAG: rhodanese-like domain-containing protein [Desulfovibrionaceae bacterium]|nr:rhodanese-like domain-containing protein [Desulfovibrionaceae bacterium]MBF0514873.1 rhodanese-like domain-containing protein [Desulfovibrionaceae bacterium]
MSRLSIPWLEMAFLCLLAAGLAYAGNLLRPEPLPLWADYFQTKIAETRAKGLGAVSIAEAKRLYDAKSFLFIDAREPDEFAGGHLPGARNIPFETAYAGLDSVLDYIPKRQALVVYCSNAACPKSRDLGEQLKFLGYRDILIMSEGYDAWAAKGLPTEAK